MASSVFQQMLHHNHNKWSQLAELEDIRKHLRPTTVTPKGVPRLMHAGYRLGKNMYRINNATEARMWKPLEQRVRNSSRMSSFRHLGSVSSCSHRRPSTGNRILQHCEVLGPFYCTECLKQAQKNLYDKQIKDTFPGIDVTERMLCPNKTSYGLPMAFSLSEMSPGNATSTSSVLWHGSQYDPDLLQRRKILPLQSSMSGQVDKVLPRHGTLVGHHQDSTGTYRRQYVRFPDANDDQRSNQSKMGQANKWGEVKLGNITHTKQSERPDTSNSHGYINQVDYPRENTSEAKQRSRTIVLPHL